LEIERRDCEAVLSVRIGVADGGFSLLQFCLTQLNDRAEPEIVSGFRQV